MSIPKKPPLMETPGRKLSHTANPARGDGSRASQSKNTPAPHANRRPVAPPVYRPQKPPVVLQPKAAGVSRLPPSAGQPRLAPQAPPVYRPRPTPKVLQKSGAVQLKAKMPPAAPPVYRPNAVPLVLQRKAARPSGGAPNVTKRPTPAAPPVYRPQPTPKVLQKKEAPGLRVGAATHVKQPTLRPGPVIQRATVVVQVSKHFDAGILKDAKLFHQNHGTGVFYDDHNKQALGELDKQTVGDTHVDIFGHGNAGGVGDYDDDGLFKLLDELKPTLGMQEIRTIKFHSCDSAAPLDLEDEEDSVKLKYAGKEGTTLAQRMAEKFLNENVYVETSGFTGHTQTDLEGRSRVLKDSDKENEYRQKRDTQHGLKNWGKVREIEDEYLHTANDGSVNLGYGRESMLTRIGRSGPWLKRPELSLLQYEVHKVGGNVWDEDVLTQKARELFDNYERWKDDSYEQGISDLKNKFVHFNEK